MFTNCLQAVVALLEANLKQTFQEKIFFQGLAKELNFKIVGVTSARVRVTGN